MINWQAPKDLMLAILGIIVVFIGITISAKANKAKMGEVASTSIVLLAGLAVVALGIGMTSWPQFGGQILSMIGIRTG